MQKNNKKQEKKNKQMNKNWEYCKLLQTNECKVIL